jgi:peptidoglycan-associated lipoprotein
MPRAAAAVEDRGAAAAGRGRDVRLDETAEAAEPEVVAFGARCCLEKTIHRDKLEKSYLERGREKMRDGVRAFGAVILALAMIVSACGKKKPATAPPPPASAEAPRTTPPQPPPPPPAPAPAVQPHVPTDDEIFGGKTLDQLNAEKPLADAYFDLDSQTIRDDAKPPLQKDADWLKRWASTKVMVEGHGDERGSAEYNLALGERRASAVRDYLVNLGIGADRLQVVSKGKEAPVCAESNEACWQQNRRGHFVITAK